MIEYGVNKKHIRVVSTIISYLLQDGRKFMLAWLWAKVAGGEKDPVIREPRLRRIVLPMLLTKLQFS